MRATFAGFTTARLAMRASQQALDVTGQNIANINTTGYTRQRLDLVSLHTGQGVERYRSSQATSVGNGVLVSGLSQIRDPFLDVRFRNEIANVGGTEQKSNILKQIEDIFDEVDKNGLQNYISDLSTMLQKLSDNVGNQEFDSIVKSSAGVLVQTINQYANQLETVKNQTAYDLEHVDLVQVNDILKNIETLNKSIKTNNIYGDPALELVDQRNVLLDELASFIDIDVKTVKQPIPGDPNGKTVDVLKVTQKSSDAVLIDDNKSGSISIKEPRDPEKIELTINHVVRDDDGKAIIEGIDFRADSGVGILKSTLDMLNKSGEFDAEKSDVRGIGYYEKSLDLLAKQLAETFNDLNALDGVDPADPGFVSQNLFEALGGGDITAKNIKISEKWLNMEIHINPSKDGSTTGKNDNILAMIDALKEKKEYKSGGTGELIFTGTFQEYYTNMGAVLGLDVKATDSLLDNYTTVATSIANMRSNISSVSLDEEGINILQFQKSYNAAARVMTALDEAVGTIINNMGVVGR